MSFLTERFNTDQATKHQHSPLLAGLISSYFDRVSCLYDFGCGDGYYLSEVTKRIMGRSTGIEGSEIVPNKLFPWMLHPVDVATPVILGPAGNVICMHVAEYVAPERLPGLMENINRHCRQKLVMGWLDQPYNSHHVSCKEEFDVVQMLHHLGFKYQESRSEEWRELASRDYWWMEKSLYIFQR